MPPSDKDILGHLRRQEGSTRGTARRKKYLAFMIGADRFAIPLFHVKEVIGLIKITSVPDAPSYFKGLINLRGRIISTFDLREKLGLDRKANTEPSKRPCIIITEIENLMLGAIVDDVIEVLSVEEDQIQEAIDVSNHVQKRNIHGVARIEGKPITLLLNIEQTMNMDEIRLLTKNSTQQNSAA